MPLARRRTGCAAVGAWVTEHPSNAGILRPVSSSKYRRALDLMEAEIGDELVALAPEEGQCFGFNDVATAIWRSLASPKSFNELRDELIETYDVSVEQCTRDLNELLDDMISKGLLKES